VPKTPPIIPGIDQFPGLVMHSHKYRHPETFECKKVVLLGASASGVDISIDLRNSAHTVYLSHHGDRITCKLPDNLEQHQEMKEVFADGTVLFQDGQKRQADVIIFCTGYYLSFPFLTDDCEITVKDNRITHLYKHLFNIKYPSMSFIGLGRQVCFFPQFSLQSRLVLAILSDKAMLPTKEEMLLDVAEEFKEKMSQGNKTHAHFLGPKQWEYNEEVAQLAKCEPVPPIVEKLYNYHWIFKRKDLLGYKKNEFKATSDSTWEDIATIATD
jgi:cation diffusion facilitator CzcD-associated flavoprotein CzcO